VSEEASQVVVVAIEISDPALADRLASLLGGVTGIRLATPGVKRKRSSNQLTSS